MKKFVIFLFLTLHVVLSSAQNRNDIRTYIQKVDDDNLTWIKLTITNYGDDPIMINNMCRLTRQGNEIGRSVSYVTAIAYDTYGQQIGNSNQLNFISFDVNKGVNLRKGESEVQVFLLNGKDIPSFFPPYFSIKDIRSLQLKIHLTYNAFVHNGIITATQEILTNQIRF